MSYAWYAEGTRFLDISDPENPVQVAYWRPNDTNVWAAENHKGYIYTSDANRGIDVLRLKTKAKAAGRSGQEISAPASARSISSRWWSARPSSNVG